VSGRGLVVSLSTVVLDWNKVQLFRAFLGAMRAGIVCMHSKRLPGSNDAHWEQARRSVPHFRHRLSELTSSVWAAPHWEQRTTWR
jgi:hypothetical protein